MRLIFGILIITLLCSCETQLANDFVSALNKRDYSRIEQLTSYDLIVSNDGKDISKDELYYSFKIDSLYNLNYKVDSIVSSGNSLYIYAVEEGLFDLCIEPDVDQKVKIKLVTNNSKISKIEFVRISNNYDSLIYNQSVDYMKWLEANYPQTVTKMDSIRLEGLDEFNNAFESTRLFTEHTKEYCDYKNK